MALDYADPAHEPSWHIGRLCLVALGGGAAAFAAFCAIDVVEVKVAPRPPGMQNFYWLLWLVPVATGMAAGRMPRRAPVAHRVAVAVLAAVVSAVIAWLLIVFPGMLFHVWIGGRMEL